jgi:hypothetical protein
LHEPLPEGNRRLPLFLAAQSLSVAGAEERTADAAKAPPPATARNSARVEMTLA